LLEGFCVCVNSPCRLGKNPIGDAGLSIITDGLKANPECGIRRLGCVSFQPYYIVSISYSCSHVNLLWFICCDSLLGCEITDGGVEKVCELVRTNLVETLQ